LTKIAKSIKLYKRRIVIMKGRFIALCVLFFCGYLAFAQNGVNNLGISDEELKQIIEKYLTDTFNRYLTQRDLHVSELSITADWNASTNEKDPHLYHYIAQARFRNFPINRRILSGRLETNIAVRKNAGAILGLGGRPGVEQRDQKDFNILLFVDDQLSDDLRDAYVRDYMMKNYNNPLDVDIKKERLQIYPDKIYSYVSGIVNNDRIVYLRAVFERNPPKIEKVDIFTIHETPWQLNRAEEIFSYKFPDYRDKAFRDKVQEAMFEPMKGHYERTVKGNVRTLKSSSKIESVTKIELKEVNDGMIKVEWDLTYLLDWSGWFGSFQKYNVKIHVFFQFDFEKEKWVYKGIEEIKAENIKAIS